MSVCYVIQFIIGGKDTLFYNIVGNFCQFFLLIGHKISIISVCEPDFNAYHHRQNEVAARN